MSVKPSYAVRFKEQLRILTPRKLYNLIMQTVQGRLKSARLLYLPARLSIETGNICNLKCPLCPTGRRDGDTTRGFMRFEDYRNIIDELYRDLILVRLYNWGEPLLHRDLLPMIAYARARGIGVTISTNLNTMAPAQAPALIDAGLQKIFVSCDGISDATYLQYHVGGSYATVMNNLRLLAAERRTRPACITRIIWLFHVFKHNEHEVERARAMAADMGVEIRINPMRTDMGREIFETAKAAIERDRAWIPDDPRYCAFDLEHTDVKKKKNFCALPWKEAAVNWDGSVLPCCSVYQEQYSFGNAFEQGFRAVWNGPMYRSARAQIARSSAGPTTVCHICKSTGFTHF